MNESPGARGCADGLLETRVPHVVRERWQTSLGVGQVNYEIHICRQTCFNSIALEDQTSSLFEAWRGLNRCASHAPRAREVAVSERWLELR
jgi:hypothetical protein